MARAGCRRVPVRAGRSLLASPPRQHGQVAASQQSGLLEQGSSDTGLSSAWAGCRGRSRVGELSCGCGHAAVGLTRGRCGGREGEQRDGCFWAGQMLGPDAANSPAPSCLPGAELSASGPRFALTLNLPPAAVCFFFPAACSSFTSAARHLQKLYLFFLRSCETEQSRAGSESRPAGLWAGAGSLAKTG